MSAEIVLLVAPIVLSAWLLFRSIEWWHCPDCGVWWSEEMVLTRHRPYLGKYMGERRCKVCHETEFGCRRS